MPFAVYDDVRHSMPDRGRLSVDRMSNDMVSYFLKVLLADRPNREPIVAIVVVPVLVVRIEVEVPRVVRVVLIEGRGPVVAVRTHIVETRVVAKTRSGQKVTAVS